MTNAVAPRQLHPPRFELDDAGQPVRAWIPSGTEPGKVYEFERTMRGRWCHTDARCRGWVMNEGECYHIAALEGLMNEQATQEQTEETTRAVVVQGASPLALMDDIDLHELMTKSLVPVGEWTYSFNVKGQTVEGVSVRGVQDAARALAGKGEAIRVVDVHIDLETEKEAFFVARAGRYAISPDGKEILTDTTIRGKRQPKYIKLRDGGEQFNEFWYEIGISKAARNAIDALLPTALRQWMKEQARTAPKGNTQPSNGRPPSRQSPPQSGGTRQQAASRTAQHRTQPSEDGPKHPKQQALDALVELRNAAGGTDTTEYLEAITPIQADYGTKLNPDGSFRLSDFTDDECTALTGKLRKAIGALAK